MLSKTIFVQGHVHVLQDTSDYSMKQHSNLVKNTVCLMLSPTLYIFVKDFLRLGTLVFDQGTSVFFRFLKFCFVYMQSI